MAVVVTLLLTADRAVTFQRGQTGGVDLKRQQRQREMRETMLRTTEATAAAERIDPRRVKAAIEQLKQDFKQIQVVRNEMVRDLLAHTPPNYKHISDQAGEINKRAERLKSYLMPQASQDKEKNNNNQIEFNKEEMTDALVRLCNLIASFVDNPVLKQPEVTDVEQSARAGGDLLSVIALSDNVKRSADRLNKAH
jgi:hypothetical protein